ncbi:MAG: hypothetical protein K2L16_05035, partial [Muribaculaceae bacterium]|nr:hypothetical protein [Muribaculaceae bacterium]
GREGAINILYQKRIWHSGPWAKLYKRNLILSTEMFREGIRFEDLEISPRHFLAANRVAVTSCRLYFYRNHNLSFINSWADSRLDSLKVTESILNQAKASGDRELRTAAISRRFSANFNILLSLLKRGKYDDARRCWAVIRAYRWRALTDPKVRFKKKAGALLSCGGFGFCRLIARWLGK